MLMEVTLSKKKKKNEEKKENSHGVVIVKKGELKKAHIFLSVCQKRVSQECILGFWATLDMMAMFF